MERKRIVNDGQIKWKYIGGGSLSFSGRNIKSGEVFLAFPYEISEAFRDVVVPQEPLPVFKAVDAVKSEYTLQGRGGNWFDIIDASGKVVNTKALKKVDALALVKEMEG
jgi:hypothetical protein